ncbi:MAG: hypothetical protein KatS3mg076_2069 [Candidatus Binatia bacterium]|nr:MAG: hypothetical protein KatS3mg076_2069 [Candidatus Binatia bacterium]
MNGKTRTPVGIWLALFVFLFAFSPPLVPAARSTEILEAAEQAGVVLEDVEVRDGNVSGFVVNRSSREIRDVRLLVRHVWYWKDEQNPGEESPGRAVFYTVKGELPPGARKPFTYQPDPPLPDRADGHFRTLVEVAGYSEVLP